MPTTIDVPVAPSARPLPDGPVLVTGAAGFIGSHLSERLLAEGHAVVGVDDLNDFYDPSLKRANLALLNRREGFKLVVADVRDQAGMEAVIRRCGVRSIVHLAAMPGVRPSIDRPARCAAHNVEGTVSVLEAAARRGVRRIVMASSSSVYGECARIPFAEDGAADAPISPYAASKRSCELFAHAHAHLHGLDVACLRLFTVFGPRQRPDLAIARFMRFVANGQPVPIFGDGSSSRDYTYVDDIVSGILAAAERVRGFRIWNLGGSSPVRLDELVDAIHRVTGQRVVIERHPARPGDVSRTFADLTLARRDLGYEPTVGLEEGLRRQWAWASSEPLALRQAVCRPVA